MSVVGGALRALYPYYLGPYLTLTSRYPFGTNVFDREWDVLVILDACRVDVLRGLEDEYEWLGPVGSIRSVGSSSAEWIANTFRESKRDAIEETALVTSNANVTKVLGNRDPPPNYTRARGAFPRWSFVDDDAFAYLDEVWRYGRDDAYQGSVPPRTMTDRAIAVARELDPERLIVHYQQPHAPYIHKIARGEAPEPFEVDHAFDRLRDGRVSRQRLLHSYRADLRFVLEDVALLRENVDADRLVVSADHGEAFGEWGGYEHPIGFLHPAVRRVPWAETSATDTGGYEPAVEPDHEADANLESVLEALGYVEP